MTSSPQLTIIIATYDRFELLNKCLSSVRTSLLQSPIDAYLKLVLNGEVLSESLQKKIQSYASDRLSIELVSLPSRVRPAQGRNVLLQTVATPWILFLDDDVQVPENFFSTFTQLRTQYPEMNVLGGPNLTPPNGPSTADLTGWILQESCIVGPVAGRYKKPDGTKNSVGDQFNLMLCNLFVERTLWPEIQFDGTLVTAEENHLLYELKRRSFKMLSTPELFVWHERRSTLQKFMWQIFYYGVGRGQILTRFIVLENIALFFAPLLIAFCAVYYFIPFIIILAALQVAIQMRYFAAHRRLSFKVGFYSFALWFFYGAGLIKGIFKTLWAQLKTLHQSFALLYRQNHG